MKRTTSRYLVGAGHTRRMAIGGVSLAHAPPHEPAPTDTVVDTAVDDTTVDTTLDDTTVDDTTVDDTTTEGRPGRGGPGGCDEGDGDGTAGTDATTEAPAVIEDEGTAVEPTVEATTPIDEGSL